MTETTKLRLLATILFATAMQACTTPTAPADWGTPRLEGTISGVSDVSLWVTVGDKIIRDYEDPGYCNAIIFRIDSLLQVLDKGTRKGISALEAGQHVSVYGSEDHISICPGEGGAWAVFIH